MATDCSLLTIASSCGQVFGSLLLSGILKYAPAESVVPYYCATSGFIGLLVALLLLEYSNPKETSENIPLDTE